MLDSSNGNMAILSIFFSVAKVDFALFFFFLICLIFHWPYVFLDKEISFDIATSFDYISLSLIIWHILC